MNLTTFTKQTIRVLVIVTGLVGVFLGMPHAAEARPAADARAAFRELDLSFSQMRQLRGIMQDYRQALETILTPEQLEQLEALRQTYDADAQPEGDIMTELNLSEAQVAQVAAASDDMEQALQEVLTPEQFGQLEAIELLP